MSKRKRLTPARIGETPGDDGLPPPGTLETKSMFPVFPDGVARYARAPRAAAPIASVASDAALAAAFDEVSATLATARAEGRLIQALPLAAIEPAYLVRDRLPVWDEAMEALKASLKERGQQTPIEVMALGHGRYGLISGWRRLAALGRLAEEGGPSTVLAIERSPKDAAQAYQAMVEENEVRVDLSHYERARIALKAVAHGAFDSEKQALLALFRNASRPRRSKIRAFIPIVRAFDSVLRFPAAIGERLGLALFHALEADPGLAERLAADLAATPADSPETERVRIEAALKRPKKTLNSLSGTEIRPGLRLAEGPDGALTLSGPAVDPAFRDRLTTWLRGEG